MENIKKRGLPSILCGIFYSCLCIFSIVVGLYYIITNADLNMVELSEEGYNFFKENIPISISTFFGILTFAVGIAQGISAYCLLIGKKKACWGFSLGFTIFSLLSCSSKLFMSVNAFSIIKSIAYILVLATHFMKCTKKNYE